MLVANVAPCLISASAFAGVRKNGHAMTRLEQIRCHAGAHVTKTDEAHIHEFAV
jgi:hypothetical protein